MQKILGLAPMADSTNGWKRRGTPSFIGSPLHCRHSHSPLGMFLESTGGSLEERKKLRVSMPQPSVYLILSHTPTHPPCPKPYPEKQQALDQLSCLGATNPPLPAHSLALQYTIASLLPPLPATAQGRSHVNNTCYPTQETFRAGIIPNQSPHQP